MQIEEYIVNILRNEMGIPQSNIWIQSQNRKIPPESEELYCIVGVRFFDPISVKSRWIPETAQEEQVFYGRADVQIDLLSRSNEARIRRSEILMALNSFYSKNFQDEKCFRIFKIPTSFINTSDLQGGSDINRFTLIIPTMISEKKIVGFDYYDKFRMSVQDEKSIIANINEQNYTFTVKPVPEDATVTINGVEQKSIYTYGDVNWKVEKPDYKSEEGNLFLTKDTVYNVTLQQMTTLTVLTVLPDPEDAIVKINNIEQTSITVPVGTIVKVEVSKSGYETKIENIVVDEDKSVNITLEKIPEYKYVWTGDAAADGVTFKAYSGAGVDVTNKNNTSVSYGETNLSVLNDLYSDSPTKDLQLANVSHYTAKFYVNFQDKITLKTIQMKVKAPTNATDKRLYIYNADTNERIGNILGATSKALRTINWDANANKELSGFYVQRNDTTYIIEVYSLYIEAE